jgi:hypothetical protein
MKSFVKLPAEQVIQMCEEALQKVRNYRAQLLHQEATKRCKMLNRCRKMLWLQPLTVQQVEDDMKTWERWHGYVWQWAGGWTEAVAERLMAAAMDTEGPDESVHYVYVNIDDLNSLKGVSAL